MHFNTLKLNRFQWGRGKNKQQQKTNSMQDLVFISSVKRRPLVRLPCFPDNTLDAQI